MKVRSTRLIVMASAVHPPQAVGSTVGVRLATHGVVAIASSTPE
jgi:hypothetical protein